MHYEIPGLGALALDCLILDLNGTIAIDGVLITGVAERIIKLKSQGWRIVLFTGDTHGNGKRVATELGIEIVVTPDAVAKRKAAIEIGASSCVTIGNGKIDFELFKVAKVRICTLQAEGAFASLLAESDIVVCSVNDALDILLNPKRLVATLRQ